MLLVRNKNGELEIISRSNLQDDDVLLAMGSKTELEIVKLKLETDEKGDNNALG